MPLKISYSVNFKSAKFPSKKQLVGKYSILEPLNFKNHTEELFKNFSSDKTNTLWTYMPYGPFKNLSSFIFPISKCFDLFSFSKIEPFSNLFIYVSYFP